MAGLTPAPPSGPTKHDADKEFSHAGRRLPTTGRSGAAKPAALEPEPEPEQRVTELDLDALRQRMAGLRKLSLDVRKMQSGEERVIASVARRHKAKPGTPRPPTSVRRQDPDSPRPSARALKFAHALVQAQEEQGRVQAKACAGAVQGPVDSASQQILQRMGALEQNLAPPEPEPELRAGPKAVTEPQRWGIEGIDRDDLGDSDFGEIMESPLTGIFRSIAAVSGAVGVAQRMKNNHKNTAPERTIWVGAIPDYLLAAEPTPERVAALLEELLSKFGTVEQVKPRFKVPGAEGTQREPWMGQSWGLVTFVTQAAADKAIAEGVKVRTLEQDTSLNPDGHKVKTPEGYLVLKSVNKRLVLRIAT